ncbi:MAG: YceI family protein [Chitinophagaceae bacterium]|nr:MAG: YceI family protein [Chitinophagaceae bacterium]
MKKIALVLSVVAGFVACNNSNDKDKANTTDKQAVTTAEGAAYKVDSSSLVTWTGSKPTGKHDGTFKLSEGTLLVNNNTLTGGSFTIDINSLTNLDLASAPKDKAGLEGHLKSPDFFDVQKYPTAKFEITSVEPYKADSSSKTKDATHTIKGNLTLKDATKNIAFPAKVTVDANTIAAFADFNIDRTLWNMNYKGPNNPQDWVISKEVNIKLAISATKK